MKEKERKEEEKLAHRAEGNGSAKQKYKLGG